MNFTSNFSLLTSYLRRVSGDALAHAAASEQFEDLIRPERSSNHERHGLGAIIIALAAGPHPHRELTLMRRRPRCLVAGAAWPRALLHWRPGPHPHRELTLMRRRPLCVAAGAAWPQALFHWRWGPTRHPNAAAALGTPGRLARRISDWMSADLMID